MKFTFHKDSARLPFLQKFTDITALEVRPSVYGLIVHEGQILLGQDSHSKKYVLPGGGIDKGETIQAALHREIMEETGITVQIGDFLYFEEDFFYYDPLDLAFQGYLFFYHCHPLTVNLPSIEYLPEEPLAKTLWVDIATLEPESLITRGTNILRLIQQLA